MARARHFALLLLAAASAAGAATTDEGDCRNGAFPVENPAPHLATVAGAGRTFFLSDLDGCPEAGARCRLRSYLVPGNRVVAGRTQGAYVCIYYPSRGGGTAGWMEAARFRPLATPANPPLSAWTGEWSDEGNPRLSIRIRGGALLIEGEAYWPSPDPPRREFPGGPNLGNLGETVRPDGNRAHAAECNVRFTLLGDALIAADPDMRCGGMNVSFSGIYRRERR